MLHQQNTRKPRTAKTATPTKYLSQANKRSRPKRRRRGTRLGTGGNNTDAGQDARSLHGIRRGMREGRKGGSFALKAAEGGMEEKDISTNEVQFVDSSERCIVVLPIEEDVKSRNIECEVSRAILSLSPHPRADHEEHHLPQAASRQAGRVGVGRPGDRIAVLMD